MARMVTQEQLAAAERFGDFVPVFKVDDKTIVKTGDCVRLSEAEAMKFVRARTSIPVPEVYNAYTDEATGHACIIMEFIPGDNLSKAWDQYDEAEKGIVISQLRGYMEELRQIKGTFVGSVDGSWCHDQYFDNDLGNYGPFRDETAFNEGIVRALKKADPHDWVDFTCEIWTEIMQDHEVVLTHNDLDPRNILVRGTEVVAILDWELSGFYPEYWEYCKALRRPDWESKWFKDRALDKILKPYRKELSVMWNTLDIIW